MPTKYAYKKRTFLNDSVTMSGFVIAAVEQFEYDSDDGTISSYPQIDIGDCSNKVSLDFSFYREAEMKQALKKVRLFKSVIDGFAAAFEKEVADYEAKKKSTPPKVKATKKKK